ncbi:MAG: galactose-1-phosphate uridylyltransferase [bacterium]
MPELRRNMATGEWVVLATERAKRPEEFSRRAAVTTELPARMSNCPFCQGNESMTPPALAQIGDGKTWRIRVVNNAFGAFSTTGSLSPRGNEYMRSIDAVGHHEVIIQTPAHNKPEPLLDPEQMRDIVLMYRDRHRFMEGDPRVELIIPFKNHGLMAGTSLVHPHAQIAGVPIVPTHLVHRTEEPLHYYREQRSCVFCAMLAEEMKAGERIVEENEAFVALIPFAAATPFETWIIPRAHRPSFGAIDDGEAHLFASLLRSVLRRLYYGLQNPDYNYMIRSAPREHREAPFLHWYAKIIPRLTKVAGFEMGTGMFINTARSEESAEFLRGVKESAADSRG